MNAPATAQPYLSRFWRRVLGWTAGGLVALVVVALLVGWWVVRAALPQLEGTVAGVALEAPATVLRDAQGMPTVQARSPRDLAFALGYLHGQERFFQMDLQRRAPAGELAALLGAKLVETDRKLRPHGLRAVARRVIAQTPATERAVLDAYAAGVNAGLGALAAKPWEYQLLRTTPAPWRVEDTVLTVHAMFLTLQDSDGTVERQREFIRVAQPALEPFLYSAAGEWQAPLFGAPLPAVPVPEAAVLAARGAEPAALARRGREGRGCEQSSAAACPGVAEGSLDWVAGWRGNDPEFMVGSNNWALAGKHTASGAALVADDMHLAIRVPHIWFRARLELLDANGKATSAVTGVSLPGTPMIVAGSNGHIAWGFTNSNVDTTDVVRLVPDPAQPGHYLTPAGSRPLQRRTETLQVKGGKDEALVVESSEFGPVVARDADGTALALQWVPHFAAGTNVMALGMAEARSVAQALAVARVSGIPAQNLTVGDTAGDIAWTVMGQVPQRQAPPIPVPRLSTDPAAAWQGVGPVPEGLARLNPADGRIWTANARIAGVAAPGVSDDDARAIAAYESIGGTRFDRGARTRQIRDGLLPLEQATPADLLRVHLDDRAVFLQSWQPLAVRIAAAEKVPAATLALLRTPFTNAAIDSVSYRLVRAFHREATKQVWAALVAPAQTAAGEFALKAPPEFEGALWQLVGGAAAAGAWDAVLGKALQTALAAEAKECGGTLAGCTWGRANMAKIRHPLSAAVPGLGWLVDMPATALPGDGDLPRVQRPEHGASQRFSVSPGREAEGYLQMPGGNAGNPLSPYYGAGHADWESGEPTPFLPGATRWTLQLTPSAR